MNNSRKYKICKKISPLLLVGSLLTLSSCTNEQRNFTVSYREKDYTSFMINPLDWKYNPDLVTIKNKDKNIQVDYSIEEFNNLLTSDEEFITIKSGEDEFLINREELKEWSKKVFKNTVAKENLITAKIILIIAEGTLIISFGTVIYTTSNIIVSKQKKLRKH